MTRRARRPNAASASAREFQAAAERAAAQPFELVLYISGTTPHSAAALTTMIAICRERLAGRYNLTVVDVYQEPARTKADQIVAVPTLLKKRPLPLRRLIGDLSDRARVLHGLNLPPDAESRDERARQNQSDDVGQAPQATARRGAKARGS